MEIDALIEEALATGFSHAAKLKTDTLRFLPEVRDMCSADRCHNYNKCWTCPPACGTLEEFEAKAHQFQQGIIVQSVGRIEDSFDIESMQALEKQHSKNFEKLVLRLRSRSLNFLALGAGGCTICETCSYPDEPCRFPDRAVTSMEASGLWVSDVCEKNGVEYNYGPNRMAYTSCILVD
ncbi:hypothetical protein CEB3_c39270 [Peptococcaceae bacterium CEB3]|nr:hypothetical protein CEB3_c39270 [Peptococcaceae bacterium CEB3]